jgi:hypothetical protein
MSACDVLLQLRLTFAFGALEDRVTAAVHATAVAGAPVRMKKAPASKSLTTTDSRARSAATSRPPLPCSNLAAASRAKTMAHRALEHLQGDADLTPRRKVDVAAAPVPHRGPVGFLSRDQLWEALAVRSWQSFVAVDWNGQRQAAARLVALETLQVVGNPRMSRAELHPNVIAANIELAGTLFMLGSHDLATELCEQQLAAVRAAVATASIDLPPVLHARCFLARAVCMSADQAFDPHHLHRLLAAAQEQMTAASTDTPDSENDCIRVAEAARLIEVLGVPDRSPDHSCMCVTAIASSLARSARLLATAESELCGPPASQMHARVASRLRAAVNARDREAIDLELEVDAARLKARAEALTLRLNEEARSVEKLGTSLVVAYKALEAQVGSEAVAHLRVVAQCLVVVGRCQWAANRHEPAVRWMTMAAAAFDYPSRMHLYARWSIVLARYKAPLAAFRAALDAATAEVDLNWTGHAAKVTESTRVKPRKTASPSSTYSRTLSSSPSSSDSENDDGGTCENETPEEALIRVWPQESNELAPYLRHALAAAAKAPEGLHNAELAAHYATSVVRVLGPEAKEADRALASFEAKKRIVKPPRANPSWGVVEVLKAISIITPPGVSKVLYSMSGFPTEEAAPGTEVYTQPILLTKPGRLTLRMVSVGLDGHRSGTVELHYFVVLP